MAKLRQTQESTANTATNYRGQGLVYCQVDEAARLLEEKKMPWPVVRCAEKFPEPIDTPAVIVGDSCITLSSSAIAALGSDQARLIYLSDVPKESIEVPIFRLLAAPFSGDVLRRFIASAFAELALRGQQAHLDQELGRAKNEINRLNEIGIALSTQRERESLLSLILQKSCEITSCDAGSLYLVEEGADGAQRLRFIITQNHSAQVSFQETVLPLDSSSVAGHVALTGAEVHIADVYQIPPAFSFGFNRKFDEESGYRSKSMLAVPMKNPRGEVIGVVQLINCKPEYETRLDPCTIEEIVIPFPEECRPLLRSLASQAAVALENIRLYESVEILFEGFVKASVSAIEARDPTTHGHSFRVADLTVALAESVDREATACFRDIHFSRAEMKEIRYASLLHDFGKVGVREEVLVKAKKLYPWQIELVKERFAYACKALEQEQSERKLTYLLEQGRDAYLAQLGSFDRDLAERLRELDEYLEFILRCNEPTVLPEGNFERLNEVIRGAFIDPKGQRRPLLTPREIMLLSIPQGSLDEKERLQIQSHVNHTFNFLRQIPWTREIRNIPAIASAHHEKLDGTGYPNRLSAAAIPIQSKMMTIADIYDALSATDRPYKRALASDRALDILFDEARRGLIDGAVLELFREAEIYKLVVHGHPA
jgi:HD-GYP domain-containing protein (c-di-GMP phosphodiesterase class II)